MRQIIDGKLYDTDKSKHLCSFYNHSIYRAEKGALFMTCNANSSMEQISNTNEDEIKKAIGKFCPDTYIELFGEVEEA